MSAAAWRFRGINKHPSYLGVMSREKAEERLRESVREYLTRYDKSNSSYMLSVALGSREREESSEFAHFAIDISRRDKQTEYEIKGRTGKKFKFYSDLLDSLGYRMQSESDSEIGQNYHNSRRHSSLCEKLQSKMTNNELNTVQDKTAAESMEVAKALPTKELKGVSDHPSYHGVMTGREAEQSLYEHGVSCYLTRYSQDKSTYRLSVMKKQRNGNILFQHFNITVRKNEELQVLYEVEGTEMQFDNIFKLLLFYQSNPLNHQINEIGSCLIGHPDSASFQRRRSSQPLSQHRCSLSQVPSSQQGSGCCSSFDSIDLDEELPCKKLPEIDECLRTITYTKQGVKLRFSLKEKTSHKWWDIGLQIRLKSTTLEGFSAASQGNNDRCWEKVMTEWLANAPEEYPADWKGLCALLEDVNFRHVAKQLMEAVHQTTQ